MSEYQIKAKVITGNLLPPYAIRQAVVIQANNATEAVEKAKAQYVKEIGYLDAEDYPLEIEEITKL